MAAAAGDRRGIVLKCVGGLYHVLTDGGERLECRARGLFRKDGVEPVAGDRVLVTGAGGTPVLSEVFERANILERPPVANVSLLLPVFSVREPGFNRTLLDLMLASAEALGLRCAVVITKTDLAEARRYEELYRGIGYRCVSLCGKDAGQAARIGELLVPGINLLCGNSGVGKTTLLNSFTGSERATAQISEKLGRGRHTTRETELIETAPGVFLCDSPGFSSLGIDRAAPELMPKDLAGCFPEIRREARGCRFSDCLHTGEPGCAVAEAVEKGRIDRGRYRSYIQMLKTLTDARRR